MKAFLMHRDRDVDLEAPLPANEADVRQDLELDTLLAAMAGGDRVLLDAATRSLLTSLDDPDAIRYRQQILADCLDHPAVARELYAIAVEAIERERRVFGGTLTQFPDTLLARSVDVLELFVGILRRLRHVADENGAAFRSEGFTRLFDMLARELDDEYFGIVEGHLRLLDKPGVLVSAELGRGNHGTGYVLRRRQKRTRWTDRLPFRDGPGYVYQVAERDETGYRALTELRGRGVALVASALAQSTDHILGFFRMLRSELAFYVGCLNLHDRLEAIGEPTCFPDPFAFGTTALAARNLRDANLSLIMEERVVGNDVDADGRLLVMVTGANRGGKSTFLRSVGLAQLMMQSGMFVAAESFRATVCDGLFTHFQREEDASMRSGKLDEELGRMSTIVDNLSPRGMVLLNESFASTNAREGSEIARQIVRAFLETGIRVLYVTHLFDLADGFHRESPAPALFLRAERLADGQRTLRVVEGAPEPTSHGEDLYRRIFDEDGGQEPVAPDAGAA